MRNLHKRKNGVYYVRVEINGVSVWRSLGTQNYKEALPRYHTVMAEFGRHGVRANKKVPTVVEWWDTYKNTYSTTKRAPQRDEQIIKPFLARMGRFRLNEITRSMAARYLADRGRMRVEYGPPGAKKYRTISSGTVSREHGFLQAFFQRAIDEELVERNPFKGVPRAEFKTRERVLSLEEQTEYLQRLTPKYQRWLTFMVGTGLRLEEARSIDPNFDINWQGNLVRVTGKFGKTRDVPMFPRVKEVLAEQLKNERELWTANQQRFREVLNRAARGWEEKRAKDGRVIQERRKSLRPISPHALRHTFATRFLQAGGDIYILSKILGHSSVTVTEKVYAHLLKEDLVARSRGLDLKLPKVIVKAPSRSKPVARKKNPEDFIAFCTILPPKAGALPGCATPRQKRKS